MRTQHTGHPHTDLHDVHEPHERTALRKRPEAAAHARRRTRRFLDRLRPPMSGEDAANVELVVSELVTNAVRHARGPFCTLQLRALPDGIVVTVGDADRRPPHERAPDLLDGTGGFGWPMVRRLSRTVTVTPAPGGKSVRATVPRGSGRGPR
ncbi:ATP-binding protein [Streptomyces sp. NPDC006422]|uniref:ATP-binding protein n=1 Tax=unclassified Streptomyces TaxID=2593676 RepID=UPI0033A3F490